MMKTLLLIDGREIFVDQRNDVLDLDDSEPFVVLVPAFTPHERNKILEVADMLVKSGCKEFCCVGDEANLLHDQLDAFLEDDNMLDIVTTGYNEISEGVEYFLYAAGGQKMPLRILSFGNELLINSVKSAIEQ